MPGTGQGFLQRRPICRRNAPEEGRRRPRQRVSVQVQLARHLGARLGDPTPPPNIFAQAEYQGGHTLGEAVPGCLAHKIGFRRLAAADAQIPTEGNNVTVGGAALDRFDAASAGNHLLVGSAVARFVFGEPGRSPASLFRSGTQAAGLGPAQQAGKGCPRPHLGFGQAVKGQESGIANEQPVAIIEKGDAVGCGLESRQQTLQVLTVAAEGPTGGDTPRQAAQTLAPGAGAHAQTANLGQGRTANIFQSCLLTRPAGGAGPGQS